jgi:hypothetical protein
MLCHPYADRVECHAGGKPDVVKPVLKKPKDRIAFLAAFHDELAVYFSNNNVNHVAVEYVNLGQGKKNVIRHVGEVTGVLVSAAVQAGATVEKA